MTGRPSAQHRSHKDVRVHNTREHFQFYVFCYQENVATYTEFVHMNFVYDLIFYVFIYPSLSSLAPHHCNTVTVKWNVTVCTAVARLEAFLPLRYKEIIEFYGFNEMRFIKTYIIAENASDCTNLRIFRRFKYRIPGTRLPWGN